MNNYLVEVRAYFTATRTDPDAGELVIEGWELDDRIRDPQDPNRYDFRAEQDVRLEADGAGEARRCGPEMASPLIPSSGWKVSDISLASDLVINLDNEHGPGFGPTGP